MNASREPRSHLAAEERAAVDQARRRVAQRSLRCRLLGRWPTTLRSLSQWCSQEEPKSGA